MRRLSSSLHLYFVIRLLFQNWRSAVCMFRNPPTELLARFGLLTRDPRVPGSMCEAVVRALAMRWIVPLLLMLQLSLAYSVSDQPIFSHHVLAAAALSGFFGAVLSIPAAHELMHQKNRFDHAAASMIMSMFTLSSFFGIQHTTGHHKRVGTCEATQVRRDLERAYTPFSIALSAELYHSLEIERDRSTDIPLMDAISVSNCNLCNDDLDTVWAFSR